MTVLEHCLGPPKWNVFEMNYAGQTQALKNEAERLKQVSARHRRSRSVTSCYNPSPYGDASAINWQMPDMAKLSLNGRSVSPRGGYGLWQRQALTRQKKNPASTLDNFSLTLPRHRFELRSNGWTRRVGRFNAENYRGYQPSLPSRVLQFDSQIWDLTKWCEPGWLAG